VNVGLVVYLRLVQEPSLARLHGEWTSKRSLGAGGDGTVASVYSRGIADLASYRERIPLKKEFTRLMMGIFEEAANNGLKVQGITYKPETLKDENLVVYGVSMSLGGKYAGVKSFISDLQCMSEIVTIDSLSLSSGSATEESVNLKMQLSVYLQPEDK
jgi:type IV pilus assembly protein PilO